MILRRNTDLIAKIVFLSLLVVLGLNHGVCVLHSLGILKGIVGYRIFSAMTVDFESSLPTFYNTTLVLVAFLLLLMVSLQKRNLRSDRIYDWILLTLAFLVLSLDENPAIHSYFISMISRYGEQIVMTYAWGMPYGAIAVLFVFFLIRFISSLPNDIAIGFVVSGIIYVFGALIVSAFTADILHIHHTHNTWHMLTASYEESLEMIGLSLFIYFLLMYIRIENSSLSIGEVNTNVLPFFNHH